MTDMLQSREIAEHLSLLASLLEAEVIRSNALGLKAHKDIAYKAYQIRHLADQLWQADIAFELVELPQKKSVRSKEESTLSLVARQS